jgi:glycosyltransferase involved in cell wall biosynthesis
MKLKYALITPAYNEEACIKNTIQSVISQTVLPEKWVIVSDGSTDRTEKIVKSYIAENDWIELVCMPEHKDRQFAAKVYAFNAGYKKLQNTLYDIVGNLDADITFDSTYFEFLIREFEKNQNLGVAGTPFVENGIHYDYSFTNIAHVSGACQMFRRECFKQIGGYIPVKSGGIDWIAVTTARMKGWDTRTFTAMVCFHHRKMGTGNTNIIVALFKHGRKDHYLGGHPLWQLFRAFYQMKNRPYILGGIFLLLGYIWSAITTFERPVSIELMKFHRKEQMARLSHISRRILTLSR